MSGQLNHSPADVLRYAAINYGLGTLPSGSSTWPIYPNIRPDSPDELIVISDTTAVVHGRTNPDGETQLHYGIQILVRSNDYQTGFQKAQAISQKLDTAFRLKTVSISTSTYIIDSVNKTSGVLPIGREEPESKRHLFTINATTSILKTS